jgi:hypothetical protein
MGGAYIAVYVCATREASAVSWLRTKQCRSFAAMKIAGAFIENTRLSSYEAIFMHGGEPKDHEIFAQNDRLQPDRACLGKLRHRPPRPPLKA